MPRPLSTAEVEDFREKLCEAAARIFAEKGETGFTMRELAGALGVSPMTPYRYFKDKEEILAAVRARAFEKFASTLEAAYARPGDLLAKASATGEAYVRFALEEPQTYKLMFEMWQQTDGRYPELTEAADRARKTLTRHIHPLVDTGILQGNPLILAHVFWVTLHGAVTLKLASEKFDPEFDMDGILRSAFGALMRGYAKPR